MNSSKTDSIHKEVILAARRSRVWKALTDPAEFSAWFGVNLEGTIQIGEEFAGPITCEGCEHLMLRAWVERMDPEEDFSFRWHPQAHEPDFDYTGEPTTLVEFHLEEAGDGTRLTVVESGFDGLPAKVRAESFMRNEGGWKEQMLNIQKHVDG